MSAFRKAVLSVAPERLEQFTIEMKKNISDKETRKRHVKKESSSDKNSSRSKSRKRRKHSCHESDTKKPSSSKSGHGKKSGSNRRKSAERGKSPPKSKKKDKKHRHNSSSDRKEKVKDDSDFDPNDLDLSTPLLPLSDMAKDRKLMLETAFSIVKGPKLTAMLPDILKLTPIEEIKRLCEEQLSVMSSKRIVHVLAGTEMQSSSGTDSSDDDQMKTKDSTDDGPDMELVKSVDLPLQDRSLQANHVDSTTSDHHSGPSMLFPSAVTTARASAKKKSTPTIPPRQIDNDNKDEDDVSTSTEPNFIYNDETVMKEHNASSGTEEGEVQTSGSEEDEEASNDISPCEVEATQPEVTEEIEDPQDFLDVHPNDDVLVEVEEIEEHEEEHVQADDDDDKSVENLPDKEATVEADSAVVTDNAIENDKSEPINSQGTNIATHDTATQPPTTGAPSHDSCGRSGKTQLEILELELRARAIKSLMKAAKAGMLKPIDKN